MKRVLKIYEQSMGGGNYTQVPTILLKGKWLEESGFKAGEYVKVNVDGKTISLSKTDAPPNVSKKTLHEKIDELTPEQKKKLSKMIDIL